MQRRLEDCEGDPANGCEAELATDPLRCGSCARACAFINLASDRNHCGACGDVRAGGSVYDCVPG